MRWSASARSILFSTSIRGTSAGPDLVEHLVHGVGLGRAAALGLGGVGDVQQQVRLARLLERGREGGHELVGQVRMKPTVSDSSTSCPSASRRRVVGSRVSNSVSSARHARAGERVHEARLAGVGVAGERDLGDGGRAAPLALGLAGAGDVAQAPAQGGHAVAHQAPVGLELGLAGSARADAAAEPLEVLPEALLPGVGVLELGQLHLELALGRPGVLGEDVEDDGGAVDHPGLEPVLQRALLAGGERPLGGDRGRASAAPRGREVVELAAAQVGARLRALAVLDERVDHPRAGRAQQLASSASRSSASSPSRSSEAMTTARSGPRRTSSSSGRAADPR